MVRSGCHHQRPRLGDAGKRAGDRDLVAAFAAAAPERQHLLCGPVVVREQGRGRHRSPSRQVVACQERDDLGGHIGCGHARDRGVVGLRPLAEQRHLLGLGELRAGHRRSERRPGQPRQGGLALLARDLAAAERAADAVQDLRPGRCRRLAHVRLFFHWVWNVPPAGGAGRSRKRVQPLASGRAR